MFCLQTIIAYSIYSMIVAMWVVKNFRLNPSLDLIIEMCRAMALAVKRSLDMASLHVEATM